MTQVLGMTPRVSVPMTSVSALFDTIEWSVRASRSPDVSRETYRQDFE
jgi:hypothetical protein